MELSRTIATMAVVLGVILAAGHAQGIEGEKPADAKQVEPKQAAPAAGATKQTAHERAAEREAQRRAMVQEQERRKEAYERACNKPLKTGTEFEVCRTAYKRLHVQ